MLTHDIIIAHGYEPANNELNYAEKLINIIVIIINIKRVYNKLKRDEGSRN